MKANLVSWILCGFISSALAAFGQAKASSGDERFVGTWRLISTEEKLRDGRTRPYPDLGDKATGFLMYGADGRMCVALMKDGRSSWHHEEAYGSNAEKIESASGFSSYCGKYTIDEANHVVTHYPEVSFYPNNIGTAQKRPYRVEGNRLTFSGQESGGDVERWTIIWEKEDAGGEQASGSVPDAVKEIEQWEQGARDADLKADATFYERGLADDWTGGTSWGSLQTKDILVSDLKDPKENITTKETLTDMHVRVYGDTAIATCTESYDALIHGKKTVKTIITTDTFIKRDGRWIQVAAHSSLVPEGSVR